MNHTDYIKIAAVNASSLKHILPQADGSPLKYKHRLTVERPDTPEMLVGRAFHCSTSEPEKYEERYIVLQGSQPDGWRQIWEADRDGELEKHFAIFDALTKKGTPYMKRGGAEWDSFCAKHGDDPRPIILVHELERARDLGDMVGDREMLTPEQDQRARAMAGAVQAHKAAMEHIRGCRYEETITATDPETGLLLKGRVDCIGPGREVDLKKTSFSLSPAYRWGFGFQSEKLLYHFQRAFYRHVLMLAGAAGSDFRQYIVAARDPGAGMKEPADAAIYPIGESLLAAGDKLVRVALRTLAACLELDVWPGVAPGMQAAMEAGRWTPGAEDEEMSDDEGVGF
ncbi:MAG: PD-(D/E)XK nuclease-like domain-containing protein [Chloroflexota bacterium]